MTLYGNGLPSRASVVGVSGRQRKLTFVRGKIAVRRLCGSGCVVRSVSVVKRDRGAAAACTATGSGVEIGVRQPKPHV